MEKFIESQLKLIVELIEKYKQTEDFKKELQCARFIARKELIEEILQDKADGVSSDDICKKYINSLPYYKQKIKDWQNG